MSPVTSTTRAWTAALALGLATYSSSASAFDRVTERRADAYFDARGELVGLRNADLPEGQTPTPMSQRERFAQMGIQLPDRPASLKPRTLLPKPRAVDVFRGLTLDKVVVKFVDDVPVR